jgi:cobyrinic acid a,c-diamide synthase
MSAGQDTQQTPSFLVAGTQSGCGKTTVTLGLLAAFQKKGLTVQPFKCGPDFIDPSLHQLVTGQVSRNLDIWMCGDEFVRQCFAAPHLSADLRLIEGVMGMFDGGDSSSASLAKLLGVPLILVLDVRSAAESASAVLKGFELFDSDICPAGVILNRVGSLRHLELLEKAIHTYCQTPVLGYLPGNKQFNLPGRHLGLHMGGEEPIDREMLASLADTVLEHIDTDRLLEIGRETAAQAGYSKRRLPCSDTVRLGIARDKAFCFYYEDNFDLLLDAGAELFFFSPLEDTFLPEGLDGLYLGGGYPELYADQLSANQQMRRSVRDWAMAGKVLYAECGGFMYLSQSLKDLEGKAHPMAGVFPVQSTMQERRAALGYREVFLKKDCLLGPAGACLRGHEFHYSTISAMDSAVEQIYDYGEREVAGYLYKNVLAGYLHVHFGFSPQAAEAFINACRRK